MAILEKVTHTSTSQTGSRIVIAGVEKVGKTTTACDAPKPLLVPLESGFNGVKIERTPMLESYDDCMVLLDEIIAAAQKGKFPFKSIIWDTATALERLIHDKVVRMDPLYSPGNKKTVIMDSALGGYGKAYNFANDLFGALLLKCDQLALYGGINIIFTCHVFAGKVIDPAFGEYDTWDILLHSPKNNKTYGKREMLTQWADMVGFLHEPLFVTKEKDSNLSRGVSANKGRIMGLERTPGYVAGNRYGVRGEIAIGLDHPWNYLADAIYKASQVDLYNRD